MGREWGEVRTGDLIEFTDRPEAGGIITNMMDAEGEDVPVCMGVEDQRRIKAMVVHQASDGKFAVWETANLPLFRITFRRRSN